MFARETRERTQKEEKALLAKHANAANKERISIGVNLHYSRTKYFSRSFACFAGKILSHSFQVF